MAINLVNVGVTAGDGTGDLDRDAFIKINDNFTDLDNRKSEDNIIRYYDSTTATLTAMVAEINALNPPLEITSNDIYRFKLTTGEVYELKDKGKGIYGSGNLQVVEADFVKIKGLIEFSDKPTFYKFGIEYDFSDESTFETPFNYNFINGAEIISCKGTMKILGSDPDVGYSNILQFDSLNDSVAGRKLTTVISYSDDLYGKFHFNIMLQETIDQQTFRQWTWSTLPQTSPSDDTFDFDLLVNVRDLMEEDVIFFGTVNGIKYSYNNLNGQIINPTDKLAQFGFFDGAWLFNNFPKQTYINFQDGYPGYYILNKLQYGVLGKEETIYFKDVALIVTTALGYKFSVGQNAEETTGSFVIEKQEGTLFKFSDDSFKQELPTIIEVENEIVKKIKSDFNVSNFKFIRKTLRKLWDEEFLQSPNLKAVFLPEANTIAIAGNPPSITGALFNILKTNTMFILNRTTVKYRHRESLLIEEVGVSQIAVDYLNGFPELIVEPQRTNTVKNSEPAAQETDTDTNVTYLAIDNPFGFASFAKVTPSTSGASNRWAGLVQEAKFGKFTFYGDLNGRGEFKLNPFSDIQSYEFVAALGSVPFTNIKDYIISQKKIKNNYSVVESQRIPTSILSKNGIWMNQNNAAFYPVTTSGWMVEVFDVPSKFLGSYIRTTGTTKTVDADVYTITNLLSDGLLSAIEGTIIERGSNQEVRTVWTGGNRLKFIDNVLVSTTAEVPNDNAFTLDTSSYRLSEILIFNVAILPN